MMGSMRQRARLASTAVAGILATAPFALAACGGSPSPQDKAAVNGILPTTTMAAPVTTTTSAVTSTTEPGVTMPNVLGFKIAAARASLRAAGLTMVGLNKPCTKGTLASQSVVTALSVRGKAPDSGLGPVPLQPGAVVPGGSRVGIMWSGCYGTGSTVPDVVGLTFGAAKHALHRVGLAWSCYSVGRAPTTTTTTTTAPADPMGTGATATDATAAASAAAQAQAQAQAQAAVAARAKTVLTQNPPAGTVLQPGAVVTLTMRTCPL
jgi:beta-lactam-binding protein with PASTA domain